jgi:hypothetical protein
VMLPSQDDDDNSVLKGAIMRSIKGYGLWDYNGMVSFLELFTKLEVVILCDDSLVN